MAALPPPGRGTPELIEPDRSWPAILGQFLRRFASTVIVYVMTALYNKRWQLMSRTTMLVWVRRSHLVLNEDDRQHDVLGQQAIKQLYRIQAAELVAAMDAYKAQARRKRDLQ